MLILASEQKLSLRGITKGVHRKGIESSFYACDGKKVPYALSLDHFSLCIHVLKFLERLHSPNSRLFAWPLIPHIHKNSYIMWT
jgi:hypothetical protein